MKVHAFTSFTFNYLNRARVLANTLREHHENWCLWAVIVDMPPESFTFHLESEPFDRLIMGHELYPDNWERWVFQHDVVEACTGVKGRALQKIMQSSNAEVVIYLDPDIAVFNSLDPILSELEDAAIVLTPHRVVPEPAADLRAIRDNEIASLRHGIFNLGFLGVSHSADGQAFADWWASRLDDWCFDRLDDGLFVDQKWCNLVPCLFEGVKILRDPGYNVASWNLSNRELQFSSAGEAQINGHPLRFFHFTKFGPAGQTMTQRYAQENVEIYELWWWYGHQIEQMTEVSIPENWWHYDYFDNGKLIPKRVRELYKNDESLQKIYPNPFNADCGFFDLLLRDGLIER